MISQTLAPPSMLFYGEPNGICDLGVLPAGPSEHTADLCDKLQVQGRVGRFETEKTIDSPRQLRLSQSLQTFESEESPMCHGIIVLEAVAH